MLYELLQTGCYWPKQCSYLNPQRGQENVSQATSHWWSPIQWTPEFRLKGLNNFQWAMPATWSFKKSNITLSKPNVTLAQRAWLITHEVLDAILQGFMILEECQNLEGAIQNKGSILQKVKCPSENQSPSDLGCLKPALERCTLWNFLYYSPPCIIWHRAEIQYHHPQVLCHKNVDQHSLLATFGMDPPAYPCLLRNSSCWFQKNRLDQDLQPV